MKTHLFNAAELATRVNHPGPVQHVLGSPKTDPQGQPLGAVTVQAKPRPLKKTIDHDEIVVRILAVPVDDSMVERGKPVNVPRVPREVLVPTGLCVVPSVFFVCGGVSGFSL